MKLTTDQKKLLLGLIDNAMDTVIGEHFQDTVNGEYAESPAYTALIENEGDEVGADEYVESIVKKIEKAISDVIVKAGKEA